MSYMLCNTAVWTNIDEMNKHLVKKLQITYTSDETMVKYEEV